MPWFWIDYYAELHQLHEFGPYFGINDWYWSLPPAEFMLDTRITVGGWWTLLK